MHLFLDIKTLIPIPSVLVLYKKNTIIIIGWNTKAVRLGNINKETAYVLEYLGMEAPELIEKIEDVVAGTSIPYNYEKSKLERSSPKPTSLR